MEKESQTFDNAFLLHENAENDQNAEQKQIITRIKKFFSRKNLKVFIVRFIIIVGTAVATYAILLIIKRSGIVWAKDSKKSSKKGSKKGGKKKIIKYSYKNRLNEEIAPNERYDIRISRDGKAIHSPESLPSKIRNRCPNLDNLRPLNLYNGFGGSSFSEIASMSLYIGLLTGAAGFFMLEFYHFLKNSGSFKKK